MFIEPDTWNGGEIDLLCALDPGRHSVEGCLRAIWSWSCLQGPYNRFDLEPGAQTLGSPLEARYGVAALPGHSEKVAFKVTSTGDEDGHWIYAGIPLGSLGRVLPVGAYPFVSIVGASWERTVHEWLFELALHIHKHVPFERAAIGWITTMELDELASKHVPEVRYHSYLVASDSGLVRYGPNSTSPMMR